MDKKESKNFVACEYKDVTVGEEQVSLYMDAYENFGWETDERMVSSSTQGRVKLYFKRDRKIMNKMELTRLQRNFDACMEEIRQLEASKTSVATAVSIAVGIVGTAFMAGSVFAVTAQPPYVVLCIILAVPGFLGWALPYFLYKRIQRKRTEKVMPLIESKYNEIYEICEKGNRLLH
ncbi:MAG: hypothetical protein NC305_05075 [Lachnospiraceae bacterium]|nr:hypothetical protein [Muribaculum sp.]MCM1409900.1 hypothetical protein [Lachnospiraceae bacterium]